MIDEPPPLPGELGREAFGTASGLAVVVGALSVLVPDFDLLTATLVALALAGWASAHRRAAHSRRRSGRAPAGYALAFGMLAAVAVVFAHPPSELGPWRALVLGLGVVPLWSVERRWSHASRARELRR